MVIKAREITPWIALKRQHNQRSVALRSDGADKQIHYFRRLISSDLKLSPRATLRRSLGPAIRFGEAWAAPLIGAFRVTDTRLRRESLDEFVASVDALGDASVIGSHPQFRGMNYNPTFKVDQSLDPYSDEYVRQQIELYREISGRELDQENNELTTFDMERHVAQRNAFGAGMPSHLAAHYRRLGKMLALANLSATPKVLDVGCGWGLSSEFFASLGCEVTAVDINPQFVELVRRRSERFGYNIKAVQGAFDDVVLHDQYDMVVFYECLHHAVRPWKVINRFTERLKPSGIFAFAGEPVQAHWWKHWGLRLDPLSVYCIRKYGWFESGWSKNFICGSLQRAGFVVEYVEDQDPSVGSVAIARRSSSLGAVLSSSDLSKYFADDSWILDSDYLISSRRSALEIPAKDATDIRFKLSNFRSRNVHLRIECDGAAVFDTDLTPGVHDIDLKYQGPAKYVFIADVWSPAVELGSADTREFSLHLTAAEFWTSPGSKL